MLLTAQEAKQVTLKNWHKKFDFSDIFSQINSLILSAALIGHSSITYKFEKAMGIEGIDLLCFTLKSEPYKYIVNYQPAGFYGSLLISWIATPVDSGL